MTTEAKFYSVILFEDEIKAAAQAVKHFYTVVTGENPSREEAEAAAQELFKSCYVALDGAEKEGAVLLLGRKPVGFDNIV